MRDPKTPTPISTAGQVAPEPLAAPDTLPRLAADLPPATGWRFVSRERLVLCGKLLAIGACLYLFIVGIGGMGHSFKLFGKGFSEQLLKTTASPFVGLFIGILATSLVRGAERYKEKAASG